MSDTTLSVGVDFTPVITAGLTAAGDIIKLTDDELTALNSPTAIQARKNVALQADKDRANKDASDALQSKPGAIDKVNGDLA